nr:hypothetical protein HmN_000545000 [Hymenolepis microstoma]
MMTSRYRMMTNDRKESILVRTTSRLWCWSFFYHAYNLDKERRNTTVFRQVYWLSRLIYYQKCPFERPLQPIAAGNSRRPYFRRSTLWGAHGSNLKEVVLSHMSIEAIIKTVDNATSRLKSGNPHLSGS